MDTLGAGPGAGSARRGVSVAGSSGRATESGQSLGTEIAHWLALLGSQSNEAHLTEYAAR